MNYRKSPFMTGILAAVIFITFRNSLLATGYLLQAGPMSGHVSDTSAIVWLRVKVGAEMDARAIQNEKSIPPAKVENLGSGFHRLYFANLMPQTATMVELTITRPGDEPEFDQVSFETAPRPESSGSVKLAFGSCSMLSRYDGAPIYHAIAEEKPDFAIFVGDSVYFIVGDGSDRHFSTTGPVGDWSFYESMLIRHLKTRIHPDLQPMLRTVPLYAVWDDHEYGPNNEDSVYAMKEEATRAFQQMWANPSYGTENTEGIFSSFRHGPVEVFLMDDRTHKYSPAEHEDVTREDGRIWGEGQLEWLKAGLKASTAPVKLIANGTQFLNVGDRGEGHYREALGEYNSLLDFLAEEKIDGVVFLTGDRHYSEAMKQSQPDGTLVIEFTSSPLQQGREIGTIERPHENQIWSMRGNSYGLVTVSIPEEGGGTIRFEARDEQNEVPVIEGIPRKTTFELDQLRY